MVRLSDYTLLTLGETIVENSIGIFTDTLSHRAPIPTLVSLLFSLSLLYFFCYSLPSQFLYFMMPVILNFCPFSCLFLSHRLRIKRVSKRLHSHTEIWTCPHTCTLTAQSQLVADRDRGSWLGADRVARSQRISRSFCCQAILSILAGKEELWVESFLRQRSTSWESDGESRDTPVTPLTDQESRWKGLRGQRRREGRQKEGGGGSNSKGSEGKHYQR